MASATASSGLESEYTEQQLNEFREKGIKFDPVKGLYLPFPGVTVVCNVCETSAKSLERLPELLSELPTLSKTFLPLPPRSYHVTVLDIACKYKPLQEDAEWDAWLSEPRWRLAADELVSASWRPKLRLSGVRVLSRTVLAAELEPAEEGTPAHPGGLPLNRRLVEVLGLEKSQVHPWHMTIGYCSKPDELDESSADLQAELARFEASVREAVGPELGLAEARLCRFQDMQAFLPWDGQTS